MNMERPVEDEIKRYIKDKEYFGLREVHGHLLRLGYRVKKDLVMSILNGLCHEGVAIPLGCHGGQLVYQKME
jgi:hypothetical protein